MPNECGVNRNIVFKRFSFGQLLFIRIPFKFSGFCAIAILLNALELLH